MRINKLILIVYLASIAFECSADEPSSGEIRPYPTVGAAFRTPPKWKESPRNKAKTIVTWVSSDSTLERPSSLITVEVGKPTDETLEDAAQGLAKNFGGHVEDRPTTLDGSRTLRIVARHSERALLPVIGLVTFHEGRLYLVMGGTLPGRPIADEVEAIRTSWKWIAIEPTHKHLEFRKEPVPIFGGAAIMSLPERMFAYPTEHADRILDLGLANIQRNQSDFYAYVQLADILVGASFDELVTRLEKNLPAKLGLEPPLEWRVRSENPRRLATPVFIPKKPIEAIREAGNPPMRFAMVKLNERQLIIINFTITAKATPEERAVYEALSDRMIDSIKSQQ